MKYKEEHKKLAQAARDLARIIEAKKDGFKGWERCTAENGDLFGMDCNIENDIPYFIYIDSAGNGYESTEFPAERIDLSGAPVSITDGLDSRFLTAMKAAEAAGYFETK